jgi:CheY-like chemotaxis protein
VRILWVENHIHFARIAGKTFLGAHELTVVPSIAAAKDGLADGTFDAVLLDYDLDDGKGTELLAFIRALPGSPRVIATSSHDDGNGALLAAGADAVCPKTKFAAIEATLTTCLARL